MDRNLSTSYITHHFLESPKVCFHFFRLRTGVPQDSLPILANSIRKALALLRLYARIKNTAGLLLSWTNGNISKHPLHTLSWTRFTNNLVRLFFFHD